MKRGGALALTALLALAATAMIYLFLANVRGGDEAVATVNVIVARTDIPANADLDAIIKQDGFTTESVARDDLVQGAITDLRQLQGQRTAYPISAGEQIIVGRLKGSLQLPGGTLGISPGQQALTLALDPQRIVGGQVQQGDSVAIYSTFEESSAAGQEMRTVTLVTRADVLAVGLPTGAVGGTQGMTVTLSLAPRDAARTILAQENQHVYLTLLPPNQKGVKVPTVTTGSIR
jgi:pilus assembly protein CpaB